jgi:hypothetical protein
MRLDMLGAKKIKGFDQKIKKKNTNGKLDK